MPAASHLPVRSYWEEFSWRKCTTHRGAGGPASLTIGDSYSFCYRGLPQSSTILMPADGATWSAPSLHLFPEAGAFAEMRLTCRGPFAAVPMFSTSPHRRWELPLRFAHSGHRLGHCHTIRQLLVSSSPRSQVML